MWYILAPLIGAVHNATKTSTVFQKLCVTWHNLTCRTGKEIWCEKEEELVWELNSIEILVRLCGNTLKGYVYNNVIVGLSFS